MRRLIALTRSSIGRKLLMALSGLALLGFAVTHLLGNLLVLKGQDALNSYAAWLKDQGPFLWAARLGLLAIFAVHIVTGVRLALANRAARPAAYARVRTATATSFTARSMWISGIVVLLFVLFHLAHFTFGIVAADGYDAVDAQGRHDVYSMVVRSFSVPWIASLYILAMLILGAHLAHGAFSSFRTLGVHHRNVNTIVRGTSMLVVALLVLGNVAIPALVLAGAVPLPPGVSS